jgi:hypothetical protein
VAEIFSRYFPSEIQMHSFDNAENYPKKRDNWQLLQVFFAKRKIPIQINNIDALILNQQDTTLEFVKQVYTLLTERQLMLPMTIYESLQQANPGDASNQFSAADRGANDLDFFRQDRDDANKKDDESALGQSEGRKSPQKSLAIKGPPRIISDKLEIE